MYSLPLRSKGVLDWLLGAFSGSVDGGSASDDSALIAQSYNDLNRWLLDVAMSGGADARQAQYCLDTMPLPTAGAAAWFQWAVMGPAGDIQIGGIRNAAANLYELIAKQ